MMASTDGAEGRDILMSSYSRLGLPFSSAMYAMPVTVISPVSPKGIFRAWMEMVAMATTMVTIMVALTTASVLTSNLKIIYII